MGQDHEGEIQGKESQIHDDSFSHPDSGMYPDGATAQDQYRARCLPGPVRSLRGNPVSAYKLNGRGTGPALGRGRSDCPAYTAANRL